MDPVVSSRYNKQQRLTTVVNDDYINLLQYRQLLPIVMKTQNEIIISNA